MPLRCTGTSFEGPAGQKGGSHPRFCLIGCESRFRQPAAAVHRVAVRPSSSSYHRAAEQAAQNSAYLAWLRRRAALFTHLLDFMASSSVDVRSIAHITPIVNCLNEHRAQ